jgi:hypothetical protein
MPERLTPRARADFERVLQQLVGRCIEAVSYVEIAYERDGRPMWNRDSESFDSLDFGVQMTLDDDSTFSVTWGAEFTPHNVSILRGPLEFSEGSSTRRWDVGPRWRERRLLDSPVISARATWLPADPPNGREYPQDVRLEFESGAVVVLSAFEFRAGDRNMVMMDNITVFFDEVEARRRVHGPHGGA